MDADTLRHLARDILPFCVSGHIPLRHLNLDITLEHAAAEIDRLNKKVKKHG